jgi:hypothetical protein
VTSGISEQQEENGKIFQGYLYFRWNLKAHYVYPCQRFSSGNTLEDYNP